MRIHYTLLFAPAMFLASIALAQQPQAQQSQAQQPQATPEQAKVDQFVQTMSYLSDDVLAVEKGAKSLTRKSKQGAETFDENNDAELIVVTPVEHSLTNNVEELAILEPTGQIIYPGALVKGDSRLVEGRPTRITALEGPGARVVLNVNLPGLDINNLNKKQMVVQDPRYSTVDAARKEAVERWFAVDQKKGYVIPSRMFYKMADAYSSQQVLMEMGMNASSAKGSASAAMNVDAKSDKRVLIALYKQAFYTVSVDQPRLPSELMKSNVTLAEAQRVISEQAPPAYVSSVTYGRIIMLRVETDSSNTKADMQAAFDYAEGENKLGGHAKTKLAQVLKSSNVQLIVLGGAAKPAAQVVGTKSPEGLMELIRSHATFSRDNPGVPIAYKVNFLRDNELAVLGSTTNYTTFNRDVFSQGRVNLKNKAGYNASAIVTWEEFGKNASGGYGWQKKEFKWLDQPALKAATVNLKPRSRNVRIRFEHHTGVNKIQTRKDYFSATTPRITCAFKGTTLIGYKVDISADADK